MQPPENLSSQNNNDTDPSKELTRMDKLKLAGVLGTLAVGYVGVFGGYIESRSTGPMRGQAEFSLTPRGRAVVERVVGTFDSAADAVTGIFRTAPDENGEVVEFIIDEGTPESPASSKGE